MTADALVEDAERRRQAGRGDRPRSCSGRALDRHGRADHGAHRTRSQVAVRYRTSPEGGQRGGDLHQPQAVRGSSPSASASLSFAMASRSRMGRQPSSTSPRFRMHMLGRRLEQHASTRAHKPGVELLRVEAFGRDGQFEDVSFSLSAGEVLGVTGLLGSGRDRFGQGAVWSRSGGSAAGSSSPDILRASHRRSTRCGSASATCPPTGSPRGCSCRSRSAATSPSAASTG